jgi:hypothetical protein
MSDVTHIDHILSQRYPFDPVTLLFITEDAKVSFEGLVRSFRLSICLRVVSGADILFNPCFFANVSC